MMRLPLADAPRLFNALTITNYFTFSRRLFLIALNENFITDFKQSMAYDGYALIDE